MDLFHPRAAGRLLGNDDGGRGPRLGRAFRTTEAAASRGILILAGPTLGRINTGLAIIEAPNEATAHQIMDEDPTITSGLATGELRGFRVSLLRGRDG
jgi:hypothetical protein